MSTRLRWLWAQLTRPVDSWAGWAWASLVAVVPLALVGWWFGDYGLALTCGAAVSVGVAARLTWTKLGQRRRRAALDDHHV